LAARVFKHHEVCDGGVRYFTGVDFGGCAHSYLALKANEDRAVCHLRLIGVGCYRRQRKNDAQESRADSKFYRCFHTDDMLYR
jgi:hypothetical protein